MNSKLIHSLPAICASALLVGCPSSEQETSSTGNDTSTSAGDDGTGNSAVTLTADGGDSTDSGAATSMTTEMGTGESGVTMATTATGADDSSSGGDTGSGSGGGTSEGTTGMAGDCVEVAVSSFTFDGDFYLAPITGFGDPTLIDMVVLRLDETTGSFDLSMAPENSPATCAHCLTVDTDNDFADEYFQAEGTLVINADPTQGTLDGSFSGVRLIEVTIDDMGIATPVEDGGCVEFADGPIATTVVPEEWTCDVTFYGIGDGCDCGCGVFDPDCVDMTLDSCQFCDNEGSCSQNACERMPTIDPDDNAVCE